MVNAQWSILGITGSIGSGKSHVCHLLEERGIPVFYTDIEAKAEMRENPDIHRELTALIGPEAIDADGHPVKAVLADYICRGPHYADQVNAIVHPRVRERMRKWLMVNGQWLMVNGDRSMVNAQCSMLNAQCSMVNACAIESALLFESGFHTDCTATITVVAPLELRIKRIMQRDHISREKALEWINLQMPQEQKAALADHIIVNDSVTPITPQIDKILNP